MKNWISVKDRLPELGESGFSERVLVTAQSKKGIKSINIAYRGEQSWHGSGSMAGVIAWQPMPEPYKEKAI